MASINIQQRLADCLNTLRTDIARHQDGSCRSPRFDRQLFTCKGTRLSDYLQEIEHNQQRLTAATDAQEHRWLAEKLVNQIAALQREARTQQLRPRREQPKVNPRQQKLAEYREYERRLQAMIDQREQLLALAESLSVQRQLKHDLEQLEGRLARCQQAIRAVGWSLLLPGDVS